MRSKLSPEMEAIVRRTRKRAEQKETLQSLANFFRGKISQAIDDGKFPEEWGGMQLRLAFVEIMAADLERYVTPKDRRLVREWLAEANLY